MQEQTRLSATINLALPLSSGIFEKATGARTDFLEGGGFKCIPNHADTEELDLNGKRKRKMMRGCRNKALHSVGSHSRQCISMNHIL